MRLHLPLVHKHIGRPAEIFQRFGDQRRFPILLKKIRPTFMLPVVIIQDFILLIRYVSVNIFYLRHFHRIQKRVKNLHAVCDDHHILRVPDPGHTARKRVCHMKYLSLRIRIGVRIKIRHISGQIPVCNILKNFCRHIFHISLIFIIPQRGHKLFVAVILADQPFLPHDCDRRNKPQMIISNQRIVQIQIALSGPNLLPIGLIRLRSQFQKFFVRYHLTAGRDQFPKRFVQITLHGFHNSIFRLIALLPQIMLIFIFQIRHKNKRNGKHRRRNIEREDRRKMRREILP